MKTSRRGDLAIITAQREEIAILRERLRNLELINETNLPQQTTSRFPGFLYGFNPADNLDDEKYDHHIKAWWKIQHALIEAGLVTKYNQLTMWHSNSGILTDPPPINLGVIGVKKPHGKNN